MPFAFGHYNFVVGNKRFVVAVGNKHFVVAGYKRSVAGRSVGSNSGAFDYERNVSLLIRFGGLGD